LPLDEAGKLQHQTSDARLLQGEVAGDRNLFRLMVIIKQTIDGSKKT